MSVGSSRALRRTRELGFAVALSTFALNAHADILDSAFDDTEFQTVDPGTDARVTSIAWAPDGTNRLFVTRKLGRVDIIENGERRGTPFAEISTIYFQSECGLLSVAFDPDFATNHYVYFFVTVAENEQRIVRYRDDQGIGVEPTVIVQSLPTLGDNHDGGALAFGPDGKLYWAIGDLGNQTGVGADLASPAAKVGRANRDGSVPTDNPFDDGPGPNFDHTWARGFRNPFTMAFQPETGRLWLNVVGTNYEQVFVVGAGDHGGWSDHELLQPAPFLRPIVSYRTNGNDSYPIAASGAVRSDNVSTFSTTGEHWLLPGAEVTIAGVANSSFNGVGFVKDVPAPNQFSIDQSAADATSGGGTAASTELGGCITGGVFLDSTSVPSDYANNFFFGDYNSGRIVRARVSGARPTTLETWATSALNVVDMDLGPDGDLYYVSHFGWGIVHRVRYRATSQRLVLSRTNLRMLEGGRAAFHVRLATAPTAGANVSIRRASGDSDVSLAEPSALAFDATNWQVPKPVFLTARRDADGTEDTAVFEASASGIGSERLTVRVTDEFRGETPGEGGQGGAGGEAQAGAAGEAGPGQGGSATGGSSTGGGGSGVRDPGDAGQPGGGGESAGGEGSGAAPGDAGSDGGCDCGMSRGSPRELLWIAVAALLLRRRTRR